MTVADRIAEVLLQLGITRAYGLPGEDHMTLLDSLGRAGVDYRAAFNESSAVIMAATDAALTGRPGVAILSLAPGVSNGVNGLLHASMEGLPVLVLSGAHPERRRPFVIRQGFDTENLVRPMTKWTARLAAGADPAALLCKAVDIAMTSRPGPVYLEIPDEVAVTEPPRDADGAVELLARELRTGAYRPAAPEAPATVVDRLAERIHQAARPVLVVGGRRHEVSRETLSAFAATFRCPVFLSSAQKGALAPADPYLAGTFLHGNLEGRLLDGSDLVLMINPEGHDHYNRPWPYKAPLIAVTGEPDNEWLYVFQDRVVADPDALLQALVRGAPASGTASVWTTGDITEYRAGVRDALLGGAGDGPLSAVGAVEAALSACPPQTRIVADAGFSKPLVALLSQTPERTRYLASNALSTMGFAIPAAVAAARADDVPVLAFMGDGSLLMRATEIAVARGTAVPPVFVAVIDRSLFQIQVKQERKGLRDVGVALPEIRCASLAEAIGVRGVDVDTADGLRQAMADGWRGDRPLLIGAHVDKALSVPLFEVLRG